MLYLFRITLKKWSQDLVGSGYPARWNRKGEHVIYTAESASLACLENVVHRSGEGLHKNFALMKIGVPNGTAISNITPRRLPKNWSDFENYAKCQEIGSQWYHKKDTVLLRVPSAIIPEEYNYLINTTHPIFSKIKIKETRPFIFDPRIKK
ncbi:MAG: RES family NAD+ phosphorylase [Saprospiraceae bacterium]|nr:RES family NAD+ phosphorylase [Saprospiraceae bacterium]